MRIMYITKSANAKCWVSGHNMNVIDPSYLSNNNDSTVEAS